MFFYASKSLGLFLQPSSAIIIMLLAGTGLVLAGWQVVVGRRLIGLAVALLLACGWSPIGTLLVLPLEQRFAPGRLPDTVAGIVILGGFEVTSVSKARGHLAVNEAAERVMEGLLLARRLPGTRVIFTGGDGTISQRDGSAAGSVSDFLAAAGIEPQRIVLEDRSRNTYENALFLREMLAPKPGERYLLVTSAFHMPRSVGAFRQQGFDVLPWPVDYRTRGPQDAFEWLGGITGGLERVDLAFREWVGLLAYRLSGRSNALWPGPVDRPS